MVQHLLPTGLRGIVVAGLLAALMSSLAGVVQRLLDALHRRPLPKLAAARRRRSWCGPAASPRP